MRVSTVFGGLLALQAAVQAVIHDNTSMPEVNPASSKSPPFPHIYFRSHLTFSRYLARNDQVLGIRYHCLCCLPSPTPNIHNGVHYDWDFHITKPWAYYLSVRIFRSDTYLSQNLSTQDIHLHFRFSIFEKDLQSLIFQIFQEGLMLNSYKGPRTSWRASNYQSNRCGRNYPQCLDYDNDGFQHLCCSYGMSGCRFQVGTFLKRRTLETWSWIMLNIPSSRNIPPALNFWVFAQLTVLMDFADHRQNHSYYYKAYAITTLVYPWRLPDIPNAEPKQKAVSHG